MTTRVVFLSAHLPSANSKQAGQQIAYDHLHQLAQLFPVDLVSFANRREYLDVDASLKGLCQHVAIVRVTNATRLRGALLRPDLPTYVALRASRRVLRLLVELCQRSSNVVLWAEYTQMAQYVRALQGLVRRSVLVCHDVLAQLCERHARAKSWPLDRLMQFECRRLARWEAEALKYPSVAVTLSEKDRTLLTRSGAGNVVVAYPRAQFASRAATDSAGASEPTMIFLGAMDRKENHEAMLWFLDAVLPRLRSSIPSARLLIVGAHPRPGLLALCQKIEGVEVTGYVLDLQALFAKAWLAIAPLRSGAGLKIKVVECLAQGLPVVTTAIGSEGITAANGDGLIVCDEADEFARACSALLRDREASRSLGRAARRWFSTLYKPHEFGVDDARSLVLG